MMIAITGNIGSGKTVSAVKKIMDSNKICMVNFDMKAPNSVRLKKEHIIKEEIISYTKRGIAKKDLKINWNFWNRALKKYGEYHIFLDEIHNIIHSRRSMSKWNTLATMWISQIRKILGNSEKTHVYEITQRIDRMDIAFRDLLHMIIHCEKIETSQYLPTVVVENGKRILKNIPVTWIIQYYFTKQSCLEDYQYYLYRGLKKHQLRTGFIANPYFQFYDSYQIFGESPYL